jgi:hypothetical protein
MSGNQCAVERSMYSEWPWKSTDLAQYGKLGNRSLLEMSKCFVRARIGKIVGHVPDEERCLHELADSNGKQRSSQVSPVSIVSRGDA